MSKIINLKDIKNKKLHKRYIIYVLFIIILIYIFYSMYLLLKTPKETIIIKNETLTLEENANGYIIRNEKVLIGENYKNGLTPIVPEGEKAAKGQTIFRYSSSDEEQTKTKISEINLKIQEALASEPSILSKVDVKNLERQIDEKVYNIQKLNDIHTISEYKKEIEEIINKKAKISGVLSQKGSYIQQLTNQKEQLEKSLMDESEYIKANESGVVSYRVDGLEDVFNTSDFSTLTEESLNNLGLKTGKIISTSTESGKIIDNFKCYIATFLNSDVVKNIEIGNKINITLASGKEIEAKVNYIAKQNSNNTLIVFELNTLEEELIEYRRISFNITWWSFTGTGLKVPNSSIIEKENGLKYVIRKNAIGDEEILIKVLKRNDKFSIISNYTQEELVALGKNDENNKKISQYDTILLYPTK